MYDYCCESCRHETEIRHSVYARAPGCPRCGGVMKKVIRSAPAVHGHMAIGREQAIRSLQRPDDENRHHHDHGPGCGCGGHHH